MNVYKGVFFDVDELACHCCRCTYQGLDAALVHALDCIRFDLGTAIRVTSGYRCARHNEAVGGSPNSYHIHGKAADIQLHNDDDPSLGLLDVYNSADSLHWVRGIGVYQYHVHIDVRPGPRAFWMDGNPSWFLSA